ncbi:MAG: transketolase family protein [Fimbriimonadaceae bacterium]|nr:transketolase family protein [Fimbriimonadaceae bacterium]
MKLGRATRDAYGDALLELGASRPEVVVLDADLAKSTRTGKFQQAHPERFVDVGICEANMVGVAAGLAAAGKTVFCSSFGSFLLCKAFDQMRMAVAYPGENVKFVGSHGGITLGEDGASQMSVEDFALALGLPGCVVVHPADEVSAKELILQVAAQPGPAYVRVGREKAPLLYADASGVKLGQARVLREGTDVGLVACGMLLGPSLEAAELLAAEGVQAAVVDVHTLRPLDTATIARVAEATGALVVSEEHLTTAGLGAVVAQATASTCPVPMEFVGLSGYAESGAPDQLLAKYHLTTADVLAAARKVLARKR